MEIRQRLELEDVEALVDVVELLPLLPLVDGVVAAGCGGDRLHRVVGRRVMV